MFDIGFQEITLLGVIALIVVGPERLPKMARTLGLWMGKIRFYVNQVKSDIDREVRAQELKEMLDKPARDLEDVYKVAEETKGALGEAKGVIGDAKAALESASDGASETKGAPGDAKDAVGDATAATPSLESASDTSPTPAPNEPAAGTIFPPPPVDAGPQPATVDSTPEKPPASTDAAPTDEPENASGVSNEHEPTAVAAAAGDDDERTSGRV